jgi:TP901 family phage tail tape measure protein
MAERSVSVRLSANIGGYVAAMNAAKAATNGFSSQSQAHLRQLGNTMQGFGRGMTLAVSAPLAGLAVASTKMAMDFQNSFTRMVGLAEVPASEVDRLQEAVKGLSGETGRAPAELAAGLYQAASSGMNAAQALEATTLAARASALGMGQAKDSAGLIAAATNAYGKENINAAETMDILTMAIREGKAEPDEMAHALGRVIPIAAQMGIQFDEVAGATAYLSNIMGDTDQTVTGFRDALVKLNNPTVQGRETLRQMGTSFEELQAALSEGGLLGALDLLRTHGFDQNSEALQRLFADVQGFNAASALLADNSGTLATTLGKTADAAGAFDEAWQTWLGTDAARVSQAFGRIKVAMVEVGEVLLPIVANVADVVGTMASAFGDLPGPVQAAAVAFGALAATIGPLALVGGAVARNIMSIAEAVGMLRAAQAGGAGAGMFAGLGALAGLAGVAGAGAAGAATMYGIMPEEGTGWANRRNVRRGADEVLRWATFRDLRNAVGEAFSTSTTGSAAGMQVLTPEGRVRGPAQGPPTDPTWRRPEFAQGPAQGPPSLLPPNAALVRQTAAANAELRAQRDTLLAAGDAAVIYNGQLMQGAEAEQLFAHWTGVLTSEQDNFNRQINSGIDIAGQQMEAYQKSQEALQAYADVTQGEDWGRAGFDAAGDAIDRYNEYIFNGVTATAEAEGAMDDLSEALKEIDTIGAGGLEDFNLATEEGRAGMAALQQVAAAWSPKLRQAVDESDGSITDLSGRIQTLRDDFINMAVDAGIPADEAARLADAIGLIPANAKVLIEMSGAEEARIQLGLLSDAITGLSDEAQREIALKIATGDYMGALAIAQFEFRRMKAEAEGIIYIKGDSSAAQRAAIDAKDRIEQIPKQTTVTITAIDNASGVARAIQRAIAGVQSKTVTITTRRNDITTVTRVQGNTGATSTRVVGGVGSNMNVAAAEGGYFDQQHWGTWAEDGPEAIFPLTDPARIRQLMADPRVSGPMFAALAAGGGGATGSGGGTVGSGGTTTINFNAPIYGVDDLKRTLNDAFRERDARARAGVR